MNDRFNPSLSLSDLQTTTTKSAVVVFISIQGTKPRVVVVVVSLHRDRRDVKSQMWQAPNVALYYSPPYLFHDHPYCAGQ
jgi:hypothetical protein